MTEVYADREDMEFTTLDATNLDCLPEGCFDLILDKALLDTLLCSSQPFDDVSKYIGEMYRVLKPGGIFIIVSYGLPQSRLGYLNRGLPWEVNVEEIPKPPLSSNFQDATGSEVLFMQEHESLYYLYTF